MAAAGLDAWFFRWCVCVRRAMLVDFSRCVRKNEARRWRMFGETRFVPGLVIRWLLAYGEQIFAFVSVIFRESMFDLKSQKLFLESTNGSAPFGGHVTRWYYVTFELNINRFFSVADLFIGCRGSCFGVPDWKRALTFLKNNFLMVFYSFMKVKPLSKKGHLFAQNIHFILKLPICSLFL